MKTKKSYLLSLNCGNRFIHNSGAKYTHGRLCYDCGRFIEKGTLEYFMTEGHLSIWMALWNRGIDARRKKTNKDSPLELKNLMNKLYDRDYLLSLDENEAQQFMDDTYNLLNKYKISYNEASIILKR